MDTRPRNLLGTFPFFLALVPESPASSQRAVILAALSCLRGQGKCGRGSVWPIHYELSCLQSLMTAATPAALVKIQLSYTEQLQARKVLRICPKDFEVMGVSNLQRIRPQAESWSMLEAGIAMARCKRILAVFIDETEIENVSVLSIIFLITDEYGDLRMLTLVGLVVLSRKTAAAQVAAIVDSFTEVREMLEEV